MGFLLNDQISAIFVHLTVLTMYTIYVNDVGLEIKLNWFFCQKLCYIIDQRLHINVFYFPFFKGSSSTIKHDGVSQDFFMSDRTFFGHGNESRIFWSKI